MGNKSSNGNVKKTDVNELKPDVNGEMIPQMDVRVEVGGAKGWPMDTTVVFYHKGTGIICVGTSGGAVYAYGDGFQYFRQWLQEDENEVSSIVSVGSDKILVGFGDNSMAVLALPTLNVIDLVEYSWINRHAGDVVTMHVDEPGGNGFVYVGTSEGLVVIIESVASSGSIRVCDYSINWNQAGLTEKMAVSCLKMCPKDEKYLTIGYDGDTAGEGAVVVYDLMKNKPHRVYKTAAVTSLAWVHSGEYVYAGTRTGDLMIGYLEKSQCLSVWNSSSVERKDDSDSGSDISGEGGASSIIIIRKIEWLASQHRTSSTVGCLFVLLGALGDSSSETLNSVLIGLAPESITQGEKLQEVMYIPPLHMEDVVGFRIVPTVEKSADSSTETQPVPAILMVTQKESEDGMGIVRQLKVLRCPTSANIIDWALEIGMMADPRRATEVLPAGNARVTKIAALLPPHPGSLSSVLLSTASNEVNVTRSALNQVKHHAAPAGETQKTVNRRLSTRDFFAPIDVESDTWEVVMASGSQEDAALTSKSLDVVFLGHSDGTVVAWGVSKPHIGDVFGKGTVWVPLRSLGCGSAPITTISTDHIRLMAAGDESGRVVVWETFDSESGDSGLTGSSCGKYPSFDSSTGDNIVITGSRRGSDASDTESFASAASTVYVPTNFHPNDLRETFSGTVDGAVTCIELIGEAITLFVGTDAGNIYCARDWGSGELNILQIPPQAKVNASGPIVHLMYSSFWYGSSAVPAIYGFYGSGHVLVWHIFTNELIAYAAGASEMYVDANESLDILYGHVMDGDMKPLDRPDPFYKPPSPTGSPNSSPSAMPPPGSVEDVPPTPPPVTSPDSSATKKSFLSRMNSSSKNSTPEPSGGKLFGNKTQATAAPTEGPRWVVVVGCHAMILYDLGKFCVRSASGSYSNDVAGVANSKFLSEEKIITAESTIFVEEAARAYTDPVACISCVSSDGVMTIIALKSMQVMTESIEIFLLKGVERRPVSVSDGVMLPNGDCYLLNNECIVYCLSYSSTNYVHNHAVPVRAGCHHVTPPKEWQFRTGREDKVVAAKKAVQKRRASMISLSAAPTDLDKIFAKTRTDWNREELFGIQADEEACRKRAGSVQSVPQTALRSAATTKAALAEVQQSFEERGERLKQINERMEHFREAAAEYKKNSAEQRERMKAKSARWGVF